MIGMAGIMSGVMRAPMTGALFAAELTNHLSALPETIAAGSAAYAVSVLVMKRSILTEKIARRGRHISREYTVDALEFLQAGQLMTPEPGDACRRYAPRRRRAASSPTRPTIAPTRSSTSEGRLLGLVSRTDALAGIGRKAEGQLADTLSDASTRFAFPETPCGQVADMMVETGVGRIPIVDHADRRVVGIISRQDLLKVRSRQNSVEQR